MNRLSLGLFVFALAACSNPPPPPPPVAECKGLGITSITPSSGPTDHATTVRIVGNGFSADTHVFIDKAPLGSLQVSAPAGASGTTPVVADSLVKQTQDVVVTSNGGHGATDACRARLPGGWTWDNEDHALLGVQTQQPAPGGNGVGVLAPIVVTLDSEIVPASATTSAITVDGVEGTVSVDDASRKVVTFKPSAPLAYGRAYTVVVKSDGAAAHLQKKSNGKGLEKDLTWTFKTRCERCVNASAESTNTASGTASSAHYKLHAMTSAPIQAGSATEAGHNEALGAVTSPQ